MRTKTIVLPVLLAALLFTAGATLAADPADAALMFDAQRYAVSVHGELDCGDCHYDTQDQVDGGEHPNPAAMALTRPAPFDPAQCTDCHPDIEEDLEQGMHAETVVDDQELYRNCVRCHAPHREKASRYNGPSAGEPSELSEDSLACMRCHQSEPDMGPAENTLCLSCHESGSGGEAGAGLAVVQLERAAFAQAPHADLSCLSCHQDADGLPHPGSAAEDCTACHDERHTESEIHDPHLGVDCKACHLGGSDPQSVMPVRMDTRSGPIVTFAGRTELGQVSGLHDMVLEDGEGCQRCHHEDNQVGAAAMVLPAKSILCMACHAATPTLGDSVSLLGFGIFLLGMFLVLAPVFLTATKGRKSAGGHGSGPGLASAMSALFYDGLLQRRLFRRSPQRWFVHALIFQPFVIRFLWGLAAMIGTYVAPDAGWTLLLINKNNPLTALVFDLTGLALVLGCVLALMRGSNADKGLIPGLPRQDKIALWLLLAAAVLGFITEGARMAMTGMPPGSGFGFIGGLFGALFFAQSATSSIYGWLWYAHAAAWCAFVAYLPFSRLKHIIMAPVVLAMNATKKHGH